MEKEGGCFPWLKYAIYGANVVYCVSWYLLYAKKNFSLSGHYYLPWEFGYGQIADFVNFLVNGKYFNVLDLLGSNQNNSAFQNYLIDQ